jgi:predicted dinucleotide-binding enzyme
MPKVGVLGSAIVGQTLGKGFKSHGYDVRIGSRTPGKLAGFTTSAGIPAGTLAEVASWAELLVLSVKGTAAEAVLGAAGTSNLENKVVIDTTNPIAEAPPVDGVIQLFTGPNSSLLERLQAVYPQARLVKAFNSVGSARMVNPTFAAGRPTMCYCGNDPAAKAVVATILEAFGWEAADMGSAVAARAIEPLCQLWCIPGFRQNHWTHAFRILWA